MNTKIKSQNFLDIAIKNRKRKNTGGIFSAKDSFGFSCETTSGATLFSKGRRSSCFFTEDSGLYITPRQQRLIDCGITPDRGIRKWDSLSSRIVGNYKIYRPSAEDRLIKTLEETYARIEDGVSSGLENFSANFSLAKAWNMSLIGAILLGMFSMTLIYRYLGTGANAGSGSKAKDEPVAIERSVEQKVLGAESEKKVGQKEEAEYVGSVMEKFQDKKKSDLEKEIKELVKGYPIEKMVPYIMEKDKTVAAFLIGIGKKESNWGKRVPVLNDQDCYNYWGYRGKRDRMGTGGHTCFDSPKDAVDTVAKRIEFLVSNKKLDTPDKMVIWKCGSNCAATGGHVAAQKWISDVNIYFKKLND